MLTLKSGHYTKEDYEHLLRVATAARRYCVDVKEVTFFQCRECPHSMACRDLQELALYCKKKIIGNID